MANEFLVNRVVKADFVLSKTEAASTYHGGVYIPHGAIVTGVTYCQTSGTIGSANTAISATLHVGVGEVTLVSTGVISALGETAGLPVGVSTALLTAGGVYVTTETVYNGEIMLTQGVSNNNSNLTFSPSVFVGYVI